MLKKLGNNLAYIIIGLLLAGAGIVYAANVSVPQSTQKGNYLSGLSTGNYQTNTPCSNGLVLAASSTTSSGWACISPSGSSGLTSFAGMTGPAITVSTTSDANITLSVITGGNNATLTPAFIGQLSVARGGTGTNTLASLTSGSSPNLTVTGGQNVLIGTSTQILLGTNVITTLATGTSGTIFNGSIGSNTLTLNLPFASGVNTGQLLNTDWTTFNNKVSTTRNINTTVPITGGGDLSADRTIACNVASGSQAGCLASADWLLFNNKLSGSLVSGQIVFASGASTTAGSSLFTFSTATGLTNTATSTLATSTISQLSLGDGLVSTFLAADATGKVIATTTPSGGGTNYWNTVTNGIYNNTGYIVGINSSTPVGANLVVQGSSTAPTLPLFTIASSSNAGILTVLPVGTNGSGGILAIGTTTPNTLTSFFPTGTETMEIDSNSTVNPYARIVQIASNSSLTGSPVVAFYDARATNDGFARFQLGTASNHPVTFFTNNSEALAIWPSGGMSLGNSNYTNPGVNNFTLLGVIGVGTSSTTSTLSLQAGVAINPVNIASSSGASMFRINANGKVGINTTTAPGLLTLQGSSGFASDLFDIASSTGVNIFQVLNSTQSVLSVGTSSTASNLIVQGNSSFPTQPLLILASSTGNTYLKVDSKGHLVSGGPVPSVSSCGTGSPAVNGTDDQGTITLGGTAPTACTLTFSVARTNNYSCQVDNNSLTVASDVSATSTTAVTFGLGVGGLAGGNLFYHCEEFTNGN